MSTKRIKEPTISWRKLDDGDTLVKLNDQKIGVVSPLIIGGRWKWVMKPSFKVPIDLKPLLQRGYDSDIEAGKKMSKLWFAISDRIDLRNFIERSNFFDSFSYN